LDGQPLHMVLVNVWSTHVSRVSLLGINSTGPPVCREGVWGAPVGAITPSAESLLPAFSPAAP